LEFYGPIAGVANGLTKKMGPAKFQLNCKHLTVLFIEQFFASQSLDFFDQAISGSQSFYDAVYNISTF